MTQAELKQQIDDLIYTNGDLKATDFNPLMKAIVESSVPVFKRYRALLTQVAGDEPVATVLEDDLGVTITLDRATTGRYYIIADQPIFITGKTYMSIQQMEGAHIGIEHQSGTDAYLLISSNDSIGPKDDLLKNVSVEVCVYE